MIVPVIRLWRKRVIVDVDTQRHFFSDGGIVRVQNHRRVLANIRRTIQWAQLKNIHLISTVQIAFAPEIFQCGSIYTDSFGYCKYLPAVAEGRKKMGHTLLERHTSFPADDCTDLPQTILEQYDQVIFHKRCFNPFEEPRVDRMLSELQADEFILIGAVTEGAVKATALGLLARRKNVTVLVDAIGSYDSTVGVTAVRRMWVRGARLIDTNTLVGHSGQPLPTGHKIDY